jgi:hypothetical protein
MPEPASGVIEAIELTEGPGPVAVDVTRASLIEMHRDNGTYEWRTIAGAPLGQ